MAALPEPVLLLTLMLGGCTGDSAQPEGRPTDASGPDTAVPSELDTPSPEVSEASPELFRLSGSLTLLEGLLDPTLSTLTMTVDGEEPLCPLDVTTSEAQEPSPGPEVYSAWSLSVSEPCPLLPEGLVLGLGDYDPRLAAPLGGPPPDGTAYGVYVHYGPPSAPLLVFGVSSIAPEGAVTEPPLPDGTYPITPVYLLPLP